MTMVRANEGESIEVLIRKFNKKVQADGILTELKKREYYEKPSVQRKKEEALRRRGGNRRFLRD
ncbi:MAG: 30S ribosomal protein S21 [Candidatus Woykebacteria bacterium RIFCSPHIGHO2_12_FULL_43_10]|uniref:Small ribosomal subunit protein bS21 n=2 Tax=Candidatus Woykeibacteriota TaxID=1817899 RepID=A0A1G1WW95_9BACT|nr:MAG: 30S ribosomal protein S21 [Candidatus Woykebacteria bacterium RIFCSPHIGHO2_01_FULL_43_29]OGY28838.1 MAG: 30S ribosomal protein S21 [Candidatus Woykebacteria bacterium RIFCSPHIGHO2_12_FULL_43_10]OGY30199.1 MAG: 30S ribosomal protein S21 [Candidatus Woykebacteria bacterium RIFCSPHIGHO2_02_FULL_43_16b]OGY31861.1 MAG: 30S ribosomal protein S21 [Candidatus Woykebacteria bacterium RIFCSPLOWO2_01_FULL_43_14]